MKSEIDVAKARLIKTRVDELRRSERGLTFRAAWAKVGKEHPDWMESEPGEEDEAGEVRQPHIKLGVQDKVKAADYIWVRSEDIRQLERIEAALR
jgi:hypothetical protein